MFAVQNSIMHSVCLTKGRSRAHSNERLVATHVTCENQRGPMLYWPWPPPNLKRWQQHTIYKDHVLIKS
eukprot:874355-Karenia_brevis.AAC.1